MLSTYLPLGLLFLVTLGFVLTTVFASYFLGPRRRSRVKEAVFECGIPSVANARTPFNVHYFLVAILFVLFDVEIIFFYPWAVNFRLFSWTGLIEMSLFILAIGVGFLYLKQHGVLDFEKKKAGGPS